MPIESKTISPKEYIAREKLQSKEEGLTEYFDGAVYDRSYASEFHETIGGNLFGHLWLNLRNKGFKVYKSELRVKLSPTK